MVSARNMMAGGGGGVAALLALALAFALIGCEAQTPHAIEPVPGFGDSAGARPDAGLDPEPLAYAVVSSDRTVSAVALLEPDGQLLRRTFVDSGSAPAGLVTALSGDVVLPTRSGDARTLTLLDRFRADVVTRIDVARGQVLGQLRVQERKAGQSAYSSNPQDLVLFGKREAWLSRYNPNTHVDASDPDAGNDLVRIDPSAFTRGDERVDLSPLDTTAERVNPDSDEREQVRAYARPSRMVRLGRKLVVGLSRISKGFDAVGDGAVALVDVDAGEVQALLLPGLRNCSQVVPIPDDDAHVAVACTGPLAKGSGRAFAGLALLAFDGDALTLTIERIWHADDAQDAAVAVFGLIALGGDVVVAVAAGDEQTGEPDRLYRVDLSDGSQRMLLQSAQPWALGDGAYNPRARVLLVPDASIDDDGRPSAGVQRFEVDDLLEPHLLDVMAIDRALPARQIAPL